MQAGTIKEQMLCACVQLVHDTYFITYRYRSKSSKRHTLSLSSYPIISATRHHITTTTPGRTTMARHGAVHQRRALAA